MLWILSENYLVIKCIETYVQLMLNHCAYTTLNASAFQSIFEYLEKNFRYTSCF